MAFSALRSLYSSFTEPTVTSGSDSAPQGSMDERGVISGSSVPMQAGYNGQPHVNIPAYTQSWSGIDPNVQDRPSLIPIRQNGEWTAPEWLKGAADAGSTLYLGSKGYPIGESDAMALAGNFTGGGFLGGHALGPVAEAGSTVLSMSGAGGRMAAGDPKLMEEMARRGIVLPKPGDFIPGFEQRVGELNKIYSNPIHTAGSGVIAPPVSIYDLEGKQFVTSMADRSDTAKKITGIGDVQYDIPVDLSGGQGYMFNNPGELWAAAKGPAGHIQSTARMAQALSGNAESPLYIPYRMGAPSGDFSHHTTDVMLTHARSNMPQPMMRHINAQIEKVFPEFMGVENPDSMRQLSNATGKQRAAVREVLDKQFRDEGGIGIGQARLAISEPGQYSAQTGGIQNVGRFDLNRAIGQSTHPSYPYSIPGEGIGALKEQGLSIYDLLPDLAQARGVDPSMPIPQTEMYTLQTGLKGRGMPNQIDPSGKARPFVGTITDKVLRNVEARQSALRALRNP